MSDLVFGLLVGLVSGIVLGSLAVYLYLEHKAYTITSVIITKGDEYND